MDNLIHLYWIASVWNVAIAFKEHHLGVGNCLMHPESGFDRHRGIEPAVD